ncbi:MAG: hypothetical protein K2X93_05045 [Candidatus Obscuribacterales bacterium]|nr:hypothetical protein [Candidatus Obscuribacterales bacterium]
MVPSKKLLIASLCLFVVLQQAAMAAGLPQKVSGPLALVATLVGNPAPWVTGLSVDFLILRIAAIKPMRILLTVILSVVLAYPSIWFSFTAFLTQEEGSQVAWILCSVLLAITIAIVKTISYWVINEAFPSKKTALLYLGSSSLMVAAAFGMMYLNK